MAPSSLKALLSWSSLSLSSLQPSPPEAVRPAVQAPAALAVSPEIALPADAAPAVAAPAPAPETAPAVPSSPHLAPRAGGIKYFEEVGGSLALSHYDIRFFQGQVSYADHRIVLRNLVRSYLSTMRAAGVETWIAHGTLLGWWWNSRTMPWDYDADVQVANHTMAWMAAHMNNTRHTHLLSLGWDEDEDAGHSPLYVGSSPAANSNSNSNKKHKTNTKDDAHSKSDDTATTTTTNNGNGNGNGNGDDDEDVDEDDDEDDDYDAVPQTYLLDISPHHADVFDRDGANIIDARWIDVQNGMFIDITVLRERDEHKPGIWSCKNRHRYATQDLWPLRVTEFEGVEARVPYDFERILVDEYGAGCLTVEQFHKHRWDRDILEWVKMSDAEAERVRSLALERKRKDLEKQGRL